MTDGIAPISVQNKTQAVCLALEGLAREAGPEGKLPTVQALCGSLGVSRVTLDRAMGRLARIIHQYSQVAIGEELREAFGIEGAMRAHRPLTPTRTIGLS